MVMHIDKHWHNQQASNNWLSAQFNKYLQVKNMNEPVYYLTGIETEYDIMK